MALSRGLCFYILCLVKVAVTASCVSFFVGVLAISALLFHVHRAYVFSKLPEAGNRSATSIRRLVHHSAYQFLTC